MSAAEALGAYNRVAELAFTPKVYVPCRLPTLPRYSDEKLVEAIQKELELAQGSNGDREALFADPQAAKTVVLAITKINVNAGPTLFKTYDFEPAWKDCKIWEVARATSAATTFFKPIKAGRDKIAFIDAGFGYNNPCEVLLAEADRAIPGRQTSCIVSIGTGLRKAIGVNAKPFTLLKALTNMATNSHAVHSRLQETFGDKQPQKYWRFDEDVAISEIKMDDWKMLQSIAGHTHNYLNAFTTITTMQHCADSLIAAKPILQISKL
jgi:patatin-like phospholipase/acyl hydrolase